MTTCPGEGRGSGRSRSSQGSLNLLITAARMGSSYREARYWVAGRAGAMPATAHFQPDSAFSAKATQIFGRRHAEIAFEVPREVRRALVTDALRHLAHAQPVGEQQRAR